MNNIKLINARNLIFLLLAFTFPLSVPLSNILAVLLAILIIVEGSFTEKIKKINSSKWMKSILILFAIYIVYWSIFGSFTDTFWMVKRISLILLLPIFYTSSFSEKTIQKSVFVFLISMFLSSIIAIAENYEIINLNPNWTNAAFLKYTDHNVFLAAALIISVYFVFRDPKQIFSQKLRRSFILCYFFPFLFFYFLFKGKEQIYRYLVLTFIPFYQFSLFTEGGRMGQLVYLILFALLTIFLLKNYPILRFLIVTSYLFIFSVVIYHTSTVVQNRYNTQRVIYNFESSTRNTLLEETIILIKKNPIFGYGTGSFTDEFGSVNEETQKLVSNQHKTPHNNYLYVWFEIGILGLIVFLSIFYFQIKELIKKADGIFLILFPIMFLIIMLADSYLFSQNTLVLYLFLSIITINYQYKPS